MPQKANASAKEAFTVLPIRSPNKTKKVTAVGRNAEYVPITKNITTAFTGWSKDAIAGWFSRKNYIIKSINHAIFSKNSIIFRPIRGSPLLT
jgi:hypothetical protein